MGGFYLRKTFARTELFQPELKFYYLYENYQLTAVNSYSQVFKNHFGGIDLNSTFFGWLYLDYFYAATIENYDQYLVQTSASGQNSYFSEGSVQNKYPKVIVFNSKIDNLWFDLLGDEQLKVEYKYENIDYNYNPIYMDGNIAVESRVLVLPEDFSINGRKKQSIVFTQDLWRDMKEEKIRKGLSVGYGYAKYTVDSRIMENAINPTFYYSFIPGNGNSVITEYSYRFSLILSKLFRLTGRYFISSINNGTFPDGESNLDYFHLKCDSDIMDNMFLTVEYAKNFNYFKNYSVLYVKIGIWGW